MRPGGRQEASSPIDLGRSAPGRENSQGRGLEMGTCPGCPENRDEWGRLQGPHGVGPYKELGIHSECDGKPLKGFEQKDEIISQDHSECCSGNTPKGESGHSQGCVVIQVRPTAA